MRKLLIFICALALSGYAFGQITGSAHDFSGNGWSGGQICIVCHTPHNADTTVTLAPLWNHAETAATFTVYTGFDIDATISSPAGISLLCLSCHDGTIAIDSFGGTTGTVFVTGDANVGSDLRDDHPISFTYNAGLATTDGELKNPTTASSGIGGTIAEELLAGGDQLECSSCHDVHNAGFGNLLVMSNAASALCLTCHIK